MLDSTSASTGVMPAAFDVALQHEIEQFLYFEAELLDDGLFREWFALFADDVRYRMPTRTNRLARERHLSASEVGEFNLFDDSKQSLGWRVQQMETGRHWAEDPPSRTRHLVTNVRVRPAAVSDAEPENFDIRSNFLCYRNRLQDEVDLWAGERQDRLRRHGPGGWQIAQRTVLLDQAVVLSKNLSVFL